MNVIPMKDAWASALEWMHEGFRIHQQFVCAKCHAKQTMEEVNTFFERGRCEQCGYETDLWKAGCGFMAISERTE